MSRPRDIDADEATVLVRAVEGGGLDEPLLAFYGSACDSKEEKLANRQIDEGLGRILGRRVRCWQKDMDGKTVIDHRVWIAIFERESYLEGDE